MFIKRSALILAIFMLVGCGIWNVVLGDFLWAGTLTPPPSAFDNGQPVPTSPIPPSWDRKLPNSERFTVLSEFNNEAVRDNETGLVWEQSPDPDPQGSWQAGIAHCAELEVAGRKGWSLPMLQQLASLVDDDNRPPLPTGHPFDPEGVQDGFYWSASTLAPNPTFAWSVFFSNGFVGIIPKGDVEDEILTWCVRGGQVYDGQDVLEVIQEIEDTHP